MIPRIAFEPDARPPLSGIRVRRPLAPRRRQHGEPAARRFRRRGHQDRGPAQGRSVARLARQGSASTGKSMRATRRAWRSTCAPPKAGTLLRELLATASVLIENFRPGTLEEMGLRAEGAARAQSRRSIIVRVSGWGQDGPYRDRPGFGTLVEGMSGFAAKNGFADREPVLPPLALADMIAGLYGAYAVMVALREVEQRRHAAR